MKRRLVILGAGPIGLEAAVQARSLGWSDVAVYEQGDVADAVRQWQFVTLFTPWRSNTTSLGWEAIGRPHRPPDDVCPSGEQFREQYLLPLADSLMLSGVVHRQSRVLAVGRETIGKADAIGQSAMRAASPFRILLRDERDGREFVDRADVVLDCTGTYGRATHRWAGRGGVPAPGERALAQQGRTWYTMPDVLGVHRDRFADRHTLLLGCGYSAATVLQNLRRLHDRSSRTRVTWAIRRPGQALQAIHGDPLPSRSRLVQASLKLAEDPPSWLTFLGTCVLDSIAEAPNDQLDARLRVNNEREMSILCDEVVALVGYAPDATLYEQLQVHQCYATAAPMKLAAALLSQSPDAAGDCLTAGQNAGPETLLNPEPNFFILGAKSYGTNSNFLLQIGHRQVEQVFELIGAPRQAAL